MKSLLHRLLITGHDFTHPALSGTPLKRGLGTTDHGTCRLLSLFLCSAIFVTTASALDITSADAEKWKFKSKNGKTKLKAISINTIKPLSNYFALGYSVCLKPLGSVADPNDLRKLEPKAKKNGEVKKWFYKKKKDAKITYIPKKNLLKCKVWKDYPDDSVVYVDDGMELIPAGSFQMGDTFDEGNPYEWPTHDVYISSFYMDKYEVSNEKMREAMQWAFDNNKISANSTTVINNNGEQHELLDLDGTGCQINFSGTSFSFQTGKEDYPLVKLTWYGACAYANFKSEKEGLTPCYNFTGWSCNWSADGYRLPTEAEWEKAARGGQADHRFPWHDVEWISHDRANYYASDTESYDHSSGGYHPDFNTGTEPYTNPEGYFPANAYGLHDMSGNVWDWCWDRYNDDWYDQTGATISNTRGPASGDTRVLRGGGWSPGAFLARCASRFNYAPTGSYNNIGFRCVRSAP